VKHEIPDGPLNSFNQVRPEVLADVVQRTIQDLAEIPTEQLLSEALFQERMRMKRFRPNLFTRKRKKHDQALWNSVQAGLLRSPAEVDRQKILARVISHYAEEIGGHFNPKIYRFATAFVPFIFMWLLNAASVRRFLPWGMTQSLESRIKIQGEVEMLQKLSKLGTVLLVPTHQSNIDSILIGWIIHLMGLPPFAYGAGLNLFSNPVFSFFMNNLGAYTVDRNKASTIYKHTLKNYSTRILLGGVHSIFFPGGGRSRSGAVESRLKLGLLGTALEAQIEGMKRQNPHSSIFVVPMVMSYHFVLEASSLVEDYLVESGKHRFIAIDEDSLPQAKLVNFFWKLFRSKHGVSVRVGKPMDIFGNFVDENGKSLGPNHTTVDVARWLTTSGELSSQFQRDQEYTRELGSRLIDRFHRENTVLGSHLAAFALFETLRTRYPDLDLYRFLRLTLPQRSFPYTEFVESAEKHHKALLAAADRGELYVDDELRFAPTEKWLKDGIAQLGIFHEAKVITIEDGAVFTEDMSLLYYYRNRLSGYGLSLLSRGNKHWTDRGYYDAKGFLA
jgi:glycerol-3-phosphate O-acyltransferase